MDDKRLNLEIEYLATDTARKYLEAMFPNLEDLEKKAWIQNAVAFGYCTGYKDAKSDLETND